MGTLKERPKLGSQEALRDAAKCEQRRSLFFNKRGSRALGKSGRSLGRSLIMAPMLEANARAITSSLLMARLPNYEAISFSPGAGWILLVAALSLVTFFIAQRERWRRLWCIAEDPRSLGLFRIVFGIFCLCSVNELWPLFGYLFTDEGMWSTDVAQQLRAAHQFAGYGDGIGAGELWGFYDLQAFLRWLQGPNYSLLLFDSSPGFFRLHLWAFELSMLCLIVGFQTRFSKWIAWFLYLSIVSRNPVYWEGTEHFYRCFFFYLALSRCGHAYSLDNWLRCRRLRKQGQLSEPGKEGQGAGALPSPAHPKGLQAIYRRIPAWPRRLMILQLAALYLETGVLKNGIVWARGDAFYYALNLDHFYRVPPQALSALFGTTLFRLNSWVVHIWECAFPLVVLSLVVRWAQREKVAPLPRRDYTLAAASLAMVFLAMAALVIYLLPPHLPPLSFRGFNISPNIVRLGSAVGILSGAYGLYLFITSLKSDPFTLRFRQLSLTLDLDWVLRWVLGRRVWLTLTFVFHIHLVVLMNIGWFNLGVLAASIIYLNGEEVAVVLAELRNRALRAWRRGQNPAQMRPAAPERGDLPGCQRDNWKLPTPLLWGAVSVGTAGVGLQWWSSPDFFADLHQLYQDSAEIDLGRGFEMAGATLNSSGYFWAIIAGLGTAALRIQKGFSFSPTSSLLSSPRCAVLWTLLALLFGFAHVHELCHQRWLIVASVALMLLASTHKGQARGKTALPSQDSPQNIPAHWAPWAYRPLGRTLACYVCAYHILAITIWLLPEKYSFSTFRTPAQKQVEPWLEITHTTQSWTMFAPNPPRTNTFLKVVITDPQGQAIDQHSDVYACFENPEDEDICRSTYPIPWLFYSRQRKINRRIAGGTPDSEGWWQKWHARWFCKQWAYDHGGELPQKVELFKVWYPIPSPNESWNNGPYTPQEQYLAHKQEKLVYTAHCITEATAQPNQEIRRRRGLPTVPDSAIKPWYKNRCRGWEKQRREWALRNEGSIDPDDPRFRICDSEKHRKILEQRREKARRKP